MVDHPPSQIVVIRATITQEDLEYLEAVVIEMEAQGRQRLIDRLGLRQIDDSIAEIPSLQGNQARRGQMLQIRMIHRHRRTDNRRIVVITMFHQDNDMQRWEMPMAR